MSALVPRVKRAVLARRGLRRVAETGQTARSIAVIARSGLFDRGWYELQAGRSFDSDLAAVRDYVGSGRRAGWSPHPLFEPAWAEPKTWRTRTLDPFAHHLLSRGRRTKVDPHPLFGAAGYVAGHPAARTHPAGALGHFLATATASTPLPLPGPVHEDRPQAPVPWGAARAALVAAASAAAARERLAAPRQTPSFDDAAAAALRASIAGVDPGDGAGGPVVSVVMPAWNRARVLRAAVASVQAQTLTAWELVVVDDGSVDDTLAVLAGLAAFDSRIRVVQLPHGGVSRARNAGIAAARAPWLAFLDTDNTWQPDFLATMVAGMTVRGLSAGYCAMRLEHGARVTYRGYEGGVEALLVGNHVDLNVLVADTALVREVGGFAEDLRRTVDYDLVLKLAGRASVGYLPFVGAVYTADRSGADRISVAEPLSWDAVVRLRHLRSAPAAAGGHPAVSASRTSVLVPVTTVPRTPRGSGEGPVAHQLAEFLGATVPAEAGGRDVEVVVADGSGSRVVAAVLAAVVLRDPRVTVFAVPGAVGLAMATDLALDRATGATAVVVDPRSAPELGWLDALTGPLADPDVAATGAVGTDLDGLVTSAGAVFTPGVDLPVDLLAGQPAGDAAGAAEVSGVRWPLFAARTAELRAVDGLDALLGARHGDVDLSLRLVAARGGRVLTVPAARAVVPPDAPDPVQARFDGRTFADRWAGRLPDTAAAAWRATGTELAHVVSEPAAAGTRRLRPVVVRPARTVADGPAAGLPSLRWAIQTGAPAGQRRRLWGDWHFAGSLADALRRLGQDVVLLPRELAVRPAGPMDDVVLTLRGLTAREPDPATADLLWVISHPDEVGTAELARHGHVFAASLSWAEQMTALSGRVVEPLLQCTDPHLFAPPAWLAGTDRPASAVGEPVLFVGNSRKVVRPVVEQALAVRPDLAVWGGGWTGLLPDGVLRGTFLPNAELAAHYAAAGVVLNDHWADMRVNGFLSNRLFDAVASGARVVSDRIDGVTDVFGASVATFERAEQLHALLAADPDEVFPSAVDRVRTADRIRTEHSFDARARRLLDVALTDRGIEADLAGR